MIAKTYDSFLIFLLTSPFMKPIFGVGNLRDLKFSDSSLHPIQHILTKFGISSVSTRKWQPFSKNTIAFSGRNALKSVKYENGSSFLKNQYFLTKFKDRFYVHDRSMINWKFWQKFWRLPIFFFQDEKLPIASIKQVSA